MQQPKKIHFVISSRFYEFNNMKKHKNVLKYYFFSRYKSVRKLDILVKQTCVCNTK